MGKAKQIDRKTTVGLAMAALLFLVMAILLVSHDLRLVREYADYVVLLAHLGSDEACRPWTCSEVISGTTGIDAVLDGHSHDTEQVVMKNKDGRDVVRSACGARLAHVGALHITQKGKISSEVFSWASGIATPNFWGLTTR